MKTNKKIFRKILTSVFALVFCLIISIPCFAWTFPPYISDEYILAFRYNNEFVAYYSSPDGETYSISVDFSVIDMYSALDTVDSWTVERYGQNAPSAETVRPLVKAYIRSCISASSGLSVDDFKDILNEINRQYSILYNTVDSSMLPFIIPPSVYSLDIENINSPFDFISVVSSMNEQGFVLSNRYKESNISLSNELQAKIDEFNVLLERYNSLLDSQPQEIQSAYNKGYTDGVTDSKGMEETLITIFSSPYYILNEMFNFKLFGVDIFYLVMLIVSVVIVGFIIKHVV